jgi:hypothetical protein
MTTSLPPALPHDTKFKGETNILILFEVLQN